jgi:glycosyltransferase involved in cell wall biosynthesis
MNIHFVSICAPPKSGAESLQVAKYLKYLSKESNITLVTTTAMAKGWEKKETSQLRFLSNIHKVIELESLTSFNKWQSFISRKFLKIWTKRPDTDFLFHWQAKRILRELDSWPDIIYSRSVPFSSAILALKLKAKLNKPWVMHISDPWSDSPYGNYNNNYNREAEKKCFAVADLISFTTTETLSYYSQKYPEFQKKFIVTPNVYDKADVVENATLFTNAKLTCLHSGNLYGQRTIKPVIDALKESNRSTLDNLEVLLVGNIDDYNKNLIDQSGISCIKYLGAVSADESYKLQRKSDILLSIDKPVEKEIDKILLPSKIQDYIAARKFILAITGEGSATYNTIHKRYGLCFKHHMNKAIATFINDAVKAYQSRDSEFFSIVKPGTMFEAELNAYCLILHFRNLINENNQ